VNLGDHFENIIKLYESSRSLIIIFIFVSTYMYISLQYMYISLQFHYVLMKMMN